MERRYTNQKLDAGTLLTYVALAMAFSIAAIVAVALILAADVQAWDPTTLITIFFVVTGLISGAFILFR